MARIIFFLLLSFLSNAYGQSECGKRYLGSTRVVSGSTATPNSWPWQVSLRLAGTTFHFCGGSLVNDQWVVTAAHCVYGEKPSSLTVRLGEHDFNANELHQVDRAVEKVIVHPDYSTTTINNDVALIKLSSKVTLKSQLSPICLPNHGSSVDEVTGQECYITGWGRTGHDQPGATVLQQAKLPVISNTECRQHMGSGVTDKMLCAGYGGSSTVSGCMGDSGGPFVCRDKSTDRWYLHGAVSWGSRTCSAGYNEYTVFARISEFVNWINQYVGSVDPSPSETPPPATPVTCNFDQGKICSFTNDRGDVFDWTVKTGPTPSDGTGPSNDVSGSGYYAYIEASYPRKPGDVARLISPYVSGAQCLKFSYHMLGGSGDNMGFLFVYQKSSFELAVFSEFGNQGDKWISKEVQMNGQTNYRVIFEAEVGESFESDIAIDEISITPGFCGSGATTPPPTSSPSSGKCGEKGSGLSDDARIVGGQQATAGEWPWQVALLKGSFPFCGGSIVSDQYVITAAHCVTASDWSTVTIRVGEHEMGKDEGHEQDISIARKGITVHPKYNSATTDYDIAIIKLSKPIQYTSRIKPACINRGTDFTGQRCYITGWGRLSSGGTTPKILQEAQVPVVTREQCKKAYSGSITDRMFCAGYSSGGIDTCQGDSGGPLVCQHSDGSWHLTGITSWGRGCATAGYYGVYAHVANLYSWINQVTGL